MLDDVGHDFAEGFEVLAVTGWWGSGLETDFGDDEGLGGYCCEGFGEGAEHWRGLLVDGLGCGWDGKGNG